MVQRQEWRTRGPDRSAGIRPIDALGEAADVSFVPPRCPSASCSQHTQPKAGFYRRRGLYEPRCRTEPVPRLRRRVCKHGFSRQVFRHDQRDRRPECNAALSVPLASGVGPGQAGRSRALGVRAVLPQLARRIEGDLVLGSDRKASNATNARAVSGDRVCHATTAGSPLRTTFNPLLPIHTTLAMSRDDSGRPGRRFHRNRRSDTPGCLLGLVECNLLPDEVRRRRQDWGGGA